MSRSKAGSSWKFEEPRKMRSRGNRATALKCTRLNNAARPPGRSLDSVRLDRQVDVDPAISIIYDYPERPLIRPPVVPVPMNKTNTRIPASVIKETRASQGLCWLARESIQLIPRECTFGDANRRRNFTLGFISRQLHLIKGAREHSLRSPN